MAVPGVLSIAATGAAAGLEGQSDTCGEWDWQAAHDVGEALGMIERRRPSLVLLDAAVAWRDGGESCARLKAGKNADLPVALVADASAPAELLEAAFRAGVDDCIVRPLAPRHLKARLEALRTSFLAAEAGGVCAGAVSSGGVGGAAARSGEAGVGPAAGSAWSRTEGAGSSSGTATAAFAERGSRRVGVIGAAGWSRGEELERLLELNGYWVLRNPARSEVVDLWIVVASGAAPQVASWLSTGGRVLVLAPQSAPRPAALPPNLDWMASDASAPALVVQKVNALLGFASRTLRADERVAFFCPVEYREWGRADAEWSSAFSYDVSSGGLFLRTLAPARTKAALELKIHLTLTGELILATGVVAWSWRHRAAVHAPAAGMGVQFLGMPLSKRLVQLIEICRQSAA